jgi:hypothetical protein
VAWSFSDGRNVGDMAEEAKAESVARGWSETDGS